MSRQIGFVLAVVYAKSDGAANPAGNDSRLNTGSRLIEAANAGYVPAIDFNGATRASPVDIGFYETNGQSIDLGWKTGPGLNQIWGQNGPPAAPTDVTVQ